jgi:predicted phosphodiesterase
MRGDRVEVLVDIGDGVRSFEIEATKDGRRVEVATVRGNVHVTEVTRSGQEVRTAQFMAARVVAIVEHPAAEDRERKPRKAKPKQQDSLGI